MINNKRLLYALITLIPIVVISFISKNKTNFILEERETPLTVKVLYNGDVLNIELEEYVRGVVAGEMPASFEMEALKAQAVASRTYALYKKKDSNAVYDLTCTTSNQVYLDDEALRDKWKDKYEIYNKRIIDSVSGTKGEVLVYNGELIEALYFSMSSGKTQDVQSVFKEDLDYLKSTDSIYDNDSVRGFKTTVYIEEDKFKKLVGINCGEVTVNRIDYNESGYVSSITICDKEFEGNEMRKLLSLRSANFKIDVSNQIEITTYGYGHGVGMSQYGANGYAKNGYNYEKILKHYYNGVEIKNIKDV